MNTNKLNSTQKACTFFAKKWKNSPKTSEHNQVIFSVLQASSSSPLLPLFGLGWETTEGRVRNVKSARWRHFFFAMWEI